MHFRFHDNTLADQPVISVDGVTPRGPNFSHWPGNRTPPELKHDLSTGIVLALLDRPAAERDAYLQGIDIVTNNHLDSDGVISVFAMLQPSLALSHRALLLDVARTGDFQVFTSEAALAIDLTLTWITAGCDESGPGRRQAQYELALAALPGLLTDPFRHRAEITDEFGRVVADVQRVRDGEVEVTRMDDLGLAVVEAGSPLHRIAFNEAAGPSHRVLTIVPFGAGHLYRLYERVESWFDLVSRTLPPRRDLSPLGEQLDALEASESDPRWTAHPPDVPIPECYFGVPGDGPAFGPLAPGELCVSRLKPRLVTHAVVEHYEALVTDPAPSTPER